MQERIQGYADELIKMDAAMPDNDEYMVELLERKKSEKPVTPWVPRDWGADR